MKKRIKRIRGTRTCGGGSHKKRRGKGNKGGSGHAGAYSHHVVWSLKRGITKGHNASRPYQYDSSDDTTMNVGELEEMLEELLKAGKAEEKSQRITRSARLPVHLRAQKWRVVVRRRAKEPEGPGRGEKRKNAKIPQPPQTPARLRAEMRIVGRSL